MSRDVPAGVGRRPPDGTTLLHHGFWIYDPATMAAGDPVTVRGSSFYRSGKPFPVTGTSYMSDAVQRKFLFEPNPYLWEKDFREMKAAGINMVRTGIWTGWKNMMLDVGAVSEYPLRSLGAFILTAARHDTPVIFTFFAFLPELWGGVNPYLDPRSIQAQKLFISAIASRYQNTPGVIWDLINEPSFCSPEQLWLCRPNYDLHESTAWKDWLGKQAPAGDEASTAGVIRERHRLLPGEDPSLPAITEFQDTNIIGDRRPLRVGDYRLFAQEMFRRWTAEMARPEQGAGCAASDRRTGRGHPSARVRIFSEAGGFTMHNWVQRRPPRDSVDQRGRKTEPHRRNQVCSTRR